jgi:hypothetical protein
MACHHDDTDRRQRRVMMHAQATLPTLSSPAARSGFETAIPVQSTATGLRVQALDSHRRVLGTSHVFNVT